jgi:hypothetical protein
LELLDVPEVLCNLTCGKSDSENSYMELEDHRNDSGDDNDKTYTFSVKFFLQFSGLRFFQFVLLFLF